jgi:hypothetical protein
MSANIPQITTRAITSRAERLVTPPLEKYSRHSVQHTATEDYFSSATKSAGESSPMPRSPFKISKNERIPPGYVQVPGALVKPDLWSHPTITKADIKPSTTLDATGICIDPIRDEHLRAFLEAPQVAALRQAIPTKDATPQEEGNFLTKIIRICADQFNHKGLTPEQAVQRHYEDQASVYLPRLRKWLEDGQKGPRPRYEETRPLGKYMEMGQGLCIHQALLNKVMLDSLENKELKTSLQQGFMKLKPLEAGKFHDNSDAHAWNSVTMPSGRKYRVDPARKVVMPVAQKSADGRTVPVTYPNAQIENLKAAYVSFSHLLKHGNPDFKQPL